MRVVLFFHAMWAFARSRDWSDDGFVGLRTLRASIEKGISGFPGK